MILITLFVFQSLAIPSLGAVLRSSAENVEAVSRSQPARHDVHRRQDPLSLGDLVGKLGPFPSFADLPFLPGALGGAPIIKSIKREDGPSDTKIPGAKRMTLWYEGPKFGKQYVRVPSA
jgi:hypothetical protein